MVRLVDPEHADENVAFYGNTLFASSMVSLVIGLIFDGLVRGMKQKAAFHRKGNGFLYVFHLYKLYFESK